MSLAEAVQTTTEINPFLQHVLQGLNTSPKTLSPKYFYDELGSQYFDEICHLNEYYPYRTELKLLPQVAKDLNTRFNQPLTVIEFGAGSLKKIEPLLSNVEAIDTFIPIDICGEHLESAAKKLQADYPGINVRAIEADFTQSVALPPTSNARFGFFPGSTIGNFNPEDALEFLTQAGKTLGLGSHLLIGVDTKKSPDILHNAYNDALGVTAKFNLNILARINKELRGNISIHNFEHYAHYNPHLGCIQMHLISTVDQTITLGGEAITFTAGESIHTENSYKYTPKEFTHLAHLAGWQAEQTWLAPNNLFSMHLLKNTSGTQ